MSLQFLWRFLVILFVLRSPYLRGIPFFLNSEGLVRVIELRSVELVARGLNSLLLQGQVVVPVRVMLPVRSRQL